MSLLIILICSAIYYLHVSVLFLLLTLATLLFCKVSVGVGSTEGGFQIKALFELHNRNNFGVIVSPFMHGTPMYVTAIAENHAGLTSVFRSGKALIIDHTPPVVSDIDVTVSVKTDNSTILLATWKARDDETEVQRCSCSIGEYIN